LTKYGQLLSVSLIKIVKNFYTSFVAEEVAIFLFKMSTFVISYKILMLKKVRRLKE